MKCSKSTHRYKKWLHSLDSCIDCLDMFMDSIHFVCQFSQFHGNSSSVIIPAEPQLMTSQQGMLGNLIVFCRSLILITLTMVGDNRPIPQLQCSHPMHCRLRNCKMYAIKEFKIWVAYRDMLPRPQLVLLGICLGRIFCTDLTLYNTLPLIYCVPLLIW